MKRGRPPYPELLTPREQEVLALLRDGLTNQQIADRLGISRAGAAYHVSEILSRLGVASREEAARLQPETTRPRAWGLTLLGGWLGRGAALSAVKVSTAVVITGGVGLVALLAAGAAIMALREDGSQPAAIDCVTGEDARNRVAASGREVPASATFGTIEEGEAYICLDAPQLPEVDGWEAHNVNAERSHSLDYFEPGEFVSGDDGYRFLGIGYLNPRLDGLVTFAFTAYPADYLHRLSAGTIGVIAPDESCVRARIPIIEEYELLEEITATPHGTQAFIQVYAEPEQRGRGHNLFVCWEKDELIYSAYARFSPSLDYRRDILPFLDLVE